MFELNYEKGWDKFFEKFDKWQKEKIWKKIQMLKTARATKHLKYGIPFFILESGQNRICFEEKENTRTVMFVGNHKQYEKWLKKN